MYPRRHCLRGPWKTHWINIEELIMRKYFIASALIVTSFAALADGAEYEYPKAMSSGLSRAEVRAQLARAAANGELVAGEMSYVAPATGRPLSRPEVRAELDRALRNDELARGEFGYAAGPLTQPVVASR
jgi:hypothetical protein